MMYEFFGLPGAGKSYMATHLARNRRIKKIEAEDSRERFMLAARFIFSHPVFFVVLVSTLVKENWRHCKLLHHKLRTILPLTLACEQKAAAGEVIVETGFSQFLLALYERKIAVKDLEWYARWLPKKPRTIYIIEADESTRERRISERGRIPRGGVITDPDKRAEWFGLLEYNFGIIAESIKRRFTHEVIRNN